MDNSKISELTPKSYSEALNDGLLPIAVSGVDTFKMPLKDIDDRINEACDDVQAELQISIDAANNNIATLQTDLATLQTDVSGLQTQLSDLQTSLQGSITDLQNQLNNGFAMQGERIGDLENNVNTLENQVLDILNQLDDIPIIVSFTVTPNEITSGETSTLAWTTNDADTVTINEMPVSYSGTMQVSPTEDTEYTLFASNNSGLSNERAITLFVNDTPPTPTIPQVTIGTQTWMSVNLGSAGVETSNGVFYNNANSEPFTNAGKLYSRQQAIDAAALFPGWHLPSEDEWQTLIDFVGGNSVAGKKLKANSAGGTDDYGFTALMGGAYNGSYNNINNYGYWINSTLRVGSNGSQSIKTFYMAYNTDDVSGSTGNINTLRTSVRLIKDVN